MIKFCDLKPFEKQAFTDFQYKELLRHEDDCNRIRNELFFIKLRYGIEPREIYCDWIEVEE